MTRQIVFKPKSTLLLSLCIASCMAQAQDAARGNAPQAEADRPAPVEEIIVTGYRGSLLNSTNAKRESVGFKDEVFADDLGKMPSQNLAESLSRIPGVRINREVTGEGQQIAVRGLGPEFTKIVLNGNSINIASTGNINQTTNGRQVDLDIFPTELFSALSVDKTTTARQIEGGVTGYVNMRTMRPSDLGEDSNGRFALEYDYRDTNGSYSPKGAFTYGFSNDTFGALVTVVGKRGDRQVDGYETVDSLNHFGCLISDVEGNNGCRNPEVSATFRYTDAATADYVTANPGLNLAVGDTVDIYQTSGLSEAQLNAAGMPYIGRVMTTQGEKTSLSSLVSLQFTPNDQMEFVLDFLKADSNNEFVRTEVMHFYRRNYSTPTIPVDITTVNNGNGARIQSGTFYGARPWIGSRDYDEDLSVISVMPSLDWQINDLWKAKISASKTHSSFIRDNPYALFYSAPGTMTYNNDGVVPTVLHNGLDNYENYSWESFRTGHDERRTDTKGFHAEIEWGEDASINGVIFGVASDEMAAKQDFYGIRSGSVNDYLAAHGLDYVAENLGDYIKPVTMGANIDDYHGFTSAGDLNWDAFKQAINYAGMGIVPTTRTDISEKAEAVFIEGNAEFDIAGHALRTNAGVRYVTTDQYVSSQGNSTDEEYNNTLPSLSAVFDVTDAVKLRASFSRSLSRANPADMFPNAQWATSGITAVRVGNPALEPFLSDNIDVGGEWYFGELGYVGLTYFTKEVTGFTENNQRLVNFTQLGQYGLDTSDLSETQLDEFEICTPDCQVQLTTRVNIEGETKVDGWEAVWVQPLDILVEGLGFNAGYTTIDAKNDSGNKIPGIADSYNVTVYYENEVFQSRVTYYTQEGSYSFLSGGAEVTSFDRSQVDFSASYVLPVLEDYDLSITFDAYNLTNEALSDYIENDKDQTFNAYYPGTTFTLGIRGQF